MNNDPKFIRAERKAKSDELAQKYTAKSENLASTEAIIRMNEHIISSKVSLRENIEFVRNHCGLIIDTYLSGVRKIISDYEPECSTYSNTALDIYMINHKNLDEAIERFANVIITGNKIKEDN